VSGVHDLGGRPGFGRVEPEADEPVFHHAWEARVFALNLASGRHGRWNLDQSRHARELMPGYLEAGYYERWLYGLEVLLDRAGLLTRAERDSGRAGPVGPGPLRVLQAADVARVLRDPRGARADLDVPGRFRPGDRVRARDVEPAGHTRLPGYCRGRAGTVEIDQGVWVFPDTHAAGLGQKPQRVYSVRFAARELWGAQASARDAVNVDLWDDYLEPA
jgi:nitrile hydratase